MKSKISLTVVLPLIFTYSALASDMKPQVLSKLLSEKIVGGVKATKGEFPFIVSLQSSSWGHFCGGSLIASDWVLTAAHCVKNTVPMNKLKIVLGVYQQSQHEGREEFGAKTIIVHPNYEVNTDHDFDFALIQLKGKSHYSPVHLNESEIDIPKSEKDAPIATTAGWGTSSEGGRVEDTLLKVDIPLVNPNACEDAYPKEITDRMICAGYEKGGKDSCQGDSGGPLLLQNGKEKVLIGVVSWGDGCARPGKYGIYSKVNSVISWLGSELAKAGN
jgi:trypsin